MDITFFNQEQGEQKLMGENLGRVFNSRCEHACLCQAGMSESRDSQQAWNEASLFQYCLSHSYQVSNIVLTINKREITGVKRE
jgi:hypothetical protein